AVVTVPVGTVAGRLPVTIGAVPARTGRTVTIGLAFIAVPGRRAFAEGTVAGAAAILAAVESTAASFVGISFAVATVLLSHADS
ncbi:hypothetical protein CVV68_22955, partial [Arthrobacter livingstonensis]